MGFRYSGGRSALATALPAFKLDFYQRTGLHKRFQCILLVPLHHHFGQHLPACRFISDGGCSGWNVSLGALLEVKSELRMRDQIGVPITPAWHTGNIEHSIEVVEGDLDLVGLPCFLADSCDIDQAISLECAFNLSVHVLPA